MPKLSIYMVTLNEEIRIVKTLQALQNVADEIIIVDAGSKDKTIEIAKSFGAQVYYREWDNFSAQKKFAEELCSGDWLMNLDADEELSLDISREIRDIIEDDKYDICKLQFLSVRPGKLRPNPWIHHYKIIRLYKKGFAAMGNTFSCDRVSILKFDSRIGLLRGMVYHHSLLSIHQTIEKYNNYTDQQMDTIVAQGKNYSPMRMLFAINFNFILYFFLHRHFLDGYWGYIDSVNLSYLRFLKFAKFYEQQHLKDIN